MSPRSGRWTFRLKGQCLQKPDDSSPRASCGQRSWRSGRYGTRFKAKLEQLRPCRVKFALNLRMIYSSRPLCWDASWEIRRYLRTSHFSFESNLNNSNWVRAVFPNLPVFPFFLNVSNSYFGAFCKFIWSLTGFPCGWHRLSCASCAFPLLYLEPRSWQAEPRVRSRTKNDWASTKEGRNG